MNDDFIVAVDRLVSKSPEAWMSSACAALRDISPDTPAHMVPKHLPHTNNADLAFAAAEVVQYAAQLMSWEALSWALATSFANYCRVRAEQRIELLWSGPLPVNQVQARRIDQALYDQIADAKREILLVTYAAAKIERLSRELVQAIGRGVKVRLILEFEQASEGQLTYDAIRAFPAVLSSSAEIFYWPVEKRERNQAGRPGKLHAKFAIIDDTVLVSSANLTDDAFNRNLEVGVMIENSGFLKSVSEYVGGLIEEGVIAKFPRGRLAQ
jgi:phosphatidylserine/phosphatidylglycerophosphate/cardiolipin synthase-like enzyme